MNWRRITAVSAKEWAELTRDRLFLGLAFLVPPLLMLIFGYGMNMDVENIPFVVIDYDHSPESRDYLHRFIDSRYFSYKGSLDNEYDIYKLISRNEIRCAIIVPADFSQNLHARRPAQVQLILDGMIPLRAKITGGYVQAITSNYMQDQLAGFLSMLTGQPRERAMDSLRMVNLNMRYLYNETAQSIWSMAPKNIMMLLMMIPPLLTAVGIVREKERGSILNIYASSVSRGEFLVGKVIPYVLISFFNGMVLWFLAIFLFGAPFRGSIPFFLVATVFYAICTAGMGLLVSTFVSSQIAAIVITMLVTMIPSIMYSGMLLPLSSMGTGAQILAHLAPAMYYGKIIDACFLKGLGFAIMWPQLVSLAIYAAVLFGLGYSLFTKRPKA